MVRVDITNSRHESESRRSRKEGFLFVRPFCVSQTIAAMLYENIFGLQPNVCVHLFFFLEDVTKF